MPNELLINAALDCDVDAAKAAIASGANLKFRVTKSSVEDPRLDYEEKIEATVLQFCLLSKNSLHKKLTFLEFLLEQPGFKLEDSEHHTTHNANQQLLQDSGYRCTYFVSRYCVSNALIVAASRKDTYPLALLLLIRGADAGHPSLATRCYGDHPMRDHAKATGAYAYAERHGTINIVALYQSMPEQEWRNAHTIWKLGPRGTGLSLVRTFNLGTEQFQKFNFASFWWLFCILDDPKPLYALLSYENALANFKTQRPSYFDVAADLGNSHFFLELYRLRYVLPYPLPLSPEKLLPSFDTILKLARCLPQHIDWQDLDARNPELTENQLLALAYETHQFDILSLVLFCRQENVVWRDAVLDHLTEHFDACFQGNEKKILGWLEVLLLDRHSAMRERVVMLAAKIVQTFPQVFHEAAVKGSLAVLQLLCAQGAEAKELTDEELYRTFINPDRTDIAIFLLEKGAKAKWKYSQGGVEFTSMASILRSGLSIEAKKKLVAVLWRFHATLEDSRYPNLALEITRDLGVDLLNIVQANVEAHAGGIAVLENDQHQTAEVVQCVRGEMYALQGVTAAHNQQLLAIQEVASAQREQIGMLTEANACLAIEVKRCQDALAQQKNMMERMLTLMASVEERELMPSAMPFAIEAGESSTVKEPSSTDQRLKTLEAENADLRDRVTTLEEGEKNMVDRLEKMEKIMHTLQEATESRVSESGKQGTPFTRPLF